MARILLHSLVFAPDGDSTSVLMAELAVELQTVGHKVTVLTTTPHSKHEPEAVARQPLVPYWGRMLFRSEIGGVEVFHIAIPQRGTRILGRLLDYMRFHLLSLVAGLTMVGRYDVVLAPSPPLTIGLVAWLLSLMRRVPFIYNVQEIFPDVAVSLGVIRNQRLIRALERLERFIYARARVVTVISEAFRRSLLVKGVSPHKLRMISNFVDTEFMQPGARHNDFSTLHGLDDQFVVLYAGNLGLTQSFEMVLQAAARLRDLPNLRIVLVGDGGRRKWLEERLALDAIPNVKLLPFQPRSLVPHMYAACDVCLVPLKRNTAQETFPSKIYTIMATGRPVIASADQDSELCAVINQVSCGWSVPPDDADALAETIFQAYSDRAILAEMGKRGRTYVVAHHSRRAITEQLSTLIETIVPRAPGNSSANHGRSMAP